MAEKKEVTLKLTKDAVMMLRDLAMLEMEKRQNKIIEADRLGLAKERIEEQLHLSNIAADLYTSFDLLLDSFKDD